MVRCDLDRLERRALMRLALGWRDDAWDRQYAFLIREGLVSSDEDGRIGMTGAGVEVIRAWIDAPPIAWASWRRPPGRPRMGDRAAPVAGVQAPG